MIVTDFEQYSTSVKHSFNMLKLCPLRSQKETRPITFLELVRMVLDDLYTLDLKKLYKNGNKSYKISYEELVLHLKIHIRDHLEYRIIGMNSHVNMHVNTVVKDIAPFLASIILNQYAIALYDTKNKERVVHLPVILEKPAYPGISVDVSGLTYVAISNIFKKYYNSIFKILGNSGVELDPAIQVYLQSQIDIMRSKNPDDGWMLDSVKKLRVALNIENGNYDAVCSYRTPGNTNKVLNIIKKDIYCMSTKRFFINKVSMDYVKNITKHDKRSDTINALLKAVCYLVSNMQRFIELAHIDNANNFKKNVNHFKDHSTKIYQI